MGLLSDGLVHSSQEHAYALLRMAKKTKFVAFVHCFLDGATPRRRLRNMSQPCRKNVARLASNCHRRRPLCDGSRQRWERTELAYRLLVHAEGERATDPVAAIRKSYERSVTDEFVEPFVITRDDGFPVATIQDGDSVIFFNFRADRARQITGAIAVPGFDDFATPNRPHTHYVCFAVYDKTYPLPVAFPPELL
jgi:2,3-bisphosphoglycerate-independent phosphoglycerate mutase